MANVHHSVAQASILLLIAGGAAAQDTCTYKGADQGVWNNAANWTCGLVPANGNGFTYNAIIPVNIRVNFDLPGYTELTGFNLSSGATLKLEGQQLKVLGVAVQAGVVSATGLGTQYLAQSQFSTLQNNAQAFAYSGAQIAIATPSYAWTNVVSYEGRDLFRADGPGSLVDLSSMGSFSASASVNYASRYFTVAATDGGVVDLSQLTSVVGATEDDWLHFAVGSGSELRLDKLKTSTGRVFFDPDVPLFSLPSLQSLTAGYIQVESASAFNLPSAGQVDSTYIEVRANGTLDAPKLSSLTYSVLSQQSGSALHAPLLTDFRGSYAAIDSAWTLDAPSFQKIDNARIVVSGGASWSVAASSYAWTSVVSYEGRDLFRADGPGSVLNLSSVATFGAPASVNYTSGYFTVAATDGGVVDLSNVTDIVGAKEDDWLRLHIGSSSELRLGNLKTTKGRVYFDPEVSSFALPSLESVESGYMEVSIFNTVKLPALKSFTFSTLKIEDGGKIEAPGLTDFRSSYVNLNQSRFLVAPPFEKIDNAQIFLSGGASLAVAAPSYAWTYVVSYDGRDLFRADGPGSLMDLSSLSSFSAAASVNYASRAFAVVATGGGTVDMTNLATVTGASEDDWLSFDALSGGSLLFGSVELKSGRTRLRADTIDSSIVVSGDLTVNGTGIVSLTLVASMFLGGDFAYSTTDESLINLADGKVVANGSGPQTIEVGGKDLGLPIGSIPANFQMGQLTVGSFDQKSKVILADNINNGNRGPNGEPELLYLQGFPADDGLRILNGSDLVLNGIDVYAVIGNSWVHLNELIPEGEASVAFDQGRIWLTDPGECFPDIDGGGTLDVFDFLGFVNLFNAGDLAADCDGNGSLDLFDFLCFVSGFNGGC